MAVSIINNDIDLVSIYHYMHYKETGHCQVTSSIILLHLKTCAALIQSYNVSKQKTHDNGTMIHPSIHWD